MTDPFDQNHSEDYAYGVAFCKVGKENDVAENLQKLWPDVQASPAKIWKRRSCLGRKYYEIEVCIHGYVFFRARNDFVPTTKPDEMFYVLKEEDGNWHLYGEDRRFAEWILSNNGEIGLSKAYYDGQRVRILEGPLRELEGHIVKVDKRSRNAQVKLCIHNKYVYMWLGFELLENRDEQSETKHMDGGSI